MANKPPKQFKAGHKYKLTFRHKETQKLSKACSVSNTTPQNLIRDAALSTAKSITLIDEDLSQQEDK